MAERVSVGYTEAMHTIADDLPPHETQAAPPDWPSYPEIEAREPRNLLLLACHQIVFRAGWIFKTESVIMPAFLDWLAGPGAGCLRGCMPVFSRFGQSIPPVFCAERLRAMRRKKHALAGLTLSMSLPFAVLAAVCFAIDGRRCAWMPGLFLVLYGAFFVLNGLYHLSFGTLQGKLIRPTRRGHLLLVSTFWGSIPAMLFAWWLLPGWLGLPDGGFEYIFSFTAACFFLAGLTALLLSEPGDDPRQQSVTPEQGNLADTFSVLRRDRNLRRLVLVAMLFSCGLIVFPHYQAIALGPLQLPRKSLMLFVITQNAAVGIFSLFVGPLADAWGNRLTLRTLVFGSAVAPLLAALLLHVSGGLGPRLFWTVFIALGITPLVMRIVVNYTLEICELAEHPRYLSTVYLCLAVPFLFSPAVGWLVDAAGFEVVFLATAGLVLLGGYMTFRLDEPRHRLRGARLEPIVPGGEEE